MLSASRTLTTTERRVADASTIDAKNDKDASRFVIQTADGDAFLAYDLDGDMANLIHTEVPEALRGHGYGDTLARTALEWAKQEHLQVIPTCPFVKAYIRRHQQYAPLVADGTGNS